LRHTWPFCSQRQIHSIVRGNRRARLMRSGQNAATGLHLPPSGLPSPPPCVSSPAFPAIMVFPYESRSGSDRSGYHAGIHRGN
jgi:hypothetical protein